MRIAAALAGLLGGLAWVVAFVLDQTDRPEALDALEWAGLALLTVAALAAGAGLVSRSATWLRLLIAVCFALLVWSVMQVLFDGFDDRLVQAVAGAVAALVGIGALIRRPQAPVHHPGGHRSGGSHAR